MASEWYFQSMGEVYGPMSPTELREKTAQGLVVKDSLIRRGREGKWVSASKVKGLFDPKPRRQPSQRASTEREQSRKEASGNAAGATQEGSGETTACPLCGKPIRNTAQKCKHCGEYLEPNFALMMFGIGLVGYGLAAALGGMGLASGSLGLGILGFAVGIAAMVVAMIVLARQRDKREWDPAVAAAMNLVIPGLGYIYMGMVTRGVCCIIFLPIVYGSFLLFGVLIPRLHMEDAPVGIKLVCLLFFWAIPLFIHFSIVSDPFRIAKKRNSGN